MARHARPDRARRRRRSGGRFGRLSLAAARRLFIAELYEMMTVAGGSDANLRRDVKLALQPLDSTLKTTKIPEGATPSNPPARASGGHPRLEAADYQSLGEFRRAIRDFLAFSEESARDQGVTAQQHQALLAIKAHVGPEPMSIGELADCLLIKNHSAVGLVARLVERGLVRRSPSEADRRRVLLTLEPRGEEILARISQINLGKLAGAAKSLRRVLSTLKKLETAQSAKGDSSED